MPNLFSAFVFGVVAGLRSLMPVAVVSWAARTGRLRLTGTPLAFLESRPAVLTSSCLAAGELVGDKLPFTPSRTRALPFAGRLITGGLCGGAVGVSQKQVVPNVLAGVVGGLIGTLGGAKGRSVMAAAFGKDFPAAVTEDLVALALVAVALYAAPAGRPAVAGSPTIPPLRATSA